jgi:hypothetical protein
MRRTSFLLAAVAAALLLPRSVEAQNYLHQRIVATVLVADPAAAADRIESWAEAAGGYLLFKSDERVTFRFPFPRRGALIQLLEGLSEDIIELSPESQDLREAQLDAQARLRSREEILRRELALLQQADVAGTLAIEKEIISLIAEIEETKATLQRIAVDRELSWAEVSFQVLQESLPGDVPSSFGWLNTVDFYSFVGGGF